jgi:3-(3-hydroxy-phenyl)propionate hydroxylase
MSKIFEVPLYPYQRSADQDSATPVRHPVVVVGAGPIGLALAIDLAMQDVPVVVLDENDKVSWGSRAICFAKRPLEILDRLGCGDPMVDKGVVWNLGKVFSTNARSSSSTCCPKRATSVRPSSTCSSIISSSTWSTGCAQLQAEGKPIELRGGNKVVEVTQGRTASI